jgi:hypothetical protein
VKRAAKKVQKRAALRSGSRRGQAILLPPEVAALEHDSGSTWRTAYAVAFLQKRSNVPASQEFHDVEAHLRFPNHTFDEAMTVKLKINLRWSEFRNPRDGSDEAGLGILGTQARFFEVPIEDDTDDAHRKDVRIVGTAAEIVALHTALGAAIARARARPDSPPVFVGK